ncbi:MAG: carbohydrate kinase family protein [Pelomonas sp.]|nr:carbohydrate kinase family protein [Burkholderiaceae bacterium]MBV8603787.1 carbohydrate kinase family protein [Roseateles sp.]
MDSPQPQLVIIGDIGADLVMGPIAAWPQIGTETLMDRSELRGGGSAGNAALAIRHLGLQARLISAVGNDDFGRWLREQFHGLHTALQVCEVETTVSVGIMHSCGERTFFTTRGHLEHLSYAHVLEHLPPASVPGSIVLLSGVFLLPSLRARYPALLARIKALGYEIALDTGWPGHQWDAATRLEVEGWIARCDHLLINELEATSITETPDLEAAMQGLAGLLPPGASLVVKAGPRGALGIQQGVRLESAAQQATIFDTIGAGDSFNAGYLLARLRGASLRQAMDAGCESAAAILVRFPRRQIQAGELAACVAKSIQQEGEIA